MSSQDALSKALAVSPRASAAPLAARGSAAGTLALKTAYGPSSSTLAMIAGIQKQNERLSKLANPVTFPALERMRVVSESLSLGIRQTVGMPTGAALLGKNSEVARKLGATSVVAQALRANNSPLVARMNRVSEIAAIQQRAMEPLMAKIRSSIVVPPSSTVSGLVVRSAVLEGLAVSKARQSVIRDITTLDRWVERDSPTVTLPESYVDEVVERASELPPIVAQDSAASELLMEIADAMTELVAAARSGNDARQDHSIALELVACVSVFGFVNDGFSASSLPQFALSSGMGLGALLFANRASRWVREHRQ